MQLNYLAKLIPNRPRGGHGDLVVIFFLGGDNILVSGSTSVIGGNQTRSTSSNGYVYTRLKPGLVVLTLLFIQSVR